MKNTPDGDGSLLDHSAIVYGAGMSEGNGHVPENLPILLVGGGNGRLQGGRHVKFAKGTPLANFHLEPARQARRPHRQPRQQHRAGEPRLTRDAMTRLETCRSRGSLAAAAGGERRWWTR